MPFASGIYSHFGAESEDGAGMVENIEWPIDEHHVAARIAVPKDIEGYLRKVVNVDVFVHDYAEFGEHELSQTPDCAHHLPGMARIAFVDRNDGAVVKYSFPGQI